MSLGGIWRDSVECGSPNKGETAVHGCHCRGDMVVRMRKVLAVPRSSYVCFGALTGIKPMYPILFSLLWDSSVRDGQLEKLWWGARGGVGKFISNKSALTAAYHVAGFRLDREMRRLILEETLFTRWRFFTFYLIEVHTFCFWIDLVRVLATTRNTSAVAGYTRL